MNDRIWDRFAFSSLTKAIEAGNSAKASKWRDVLAGLKLGELRIGTRTPVMGMPVWATPEVIRGGYASGRYAAGGDLLAHETELAQELSFSESDASRLKSHLNSWYLSDEGLLRLKAMAQSGCFDAKTPEETALLTIALLIDNSPADVETILAQISPFFDRLRFYPVPTDTPRGDGVHVRTVGHLRSALKRKKPAQSILVQNAILTIWIPLYDRLVDLVNARSGADWDARADVWLEDYAVAQNKPMSKKWRRPEGRFQRCVHVLEARRKSKPWANDDAQYITMVIKHRALKYGKGRDRDAYRTAQSQQIVTVLHDKMAAVLLDRIKECSLSDGIEEIAPFLAPISRDEAHKGAAAGAIVGKSFARKINSVRSAPIVELVEGGQIKSPETLAAVLPQITSYLHARGFKDPLEHTVFASLYRAFSERRSLLLLNLSSQVRLEELPWAAALSKRKNNTLDDTALAGETLRELTALSLTHFPHVQFPNTLVEEMAQLADTADLKLPLTREIAADIFMGAFSGSFEKAAEIAIKRYSNTLYGRYYDLPTSIAPGQLASLCYKRAGISKSGNWSVARNGMVIEQQLILTSHNLATLFERLDDLSELNFARMSTRCFEWICTRQQTPVSDWRAKLQMVKNTAYAWRQMIAFMAELDPADQTACFCHMQEVFSQQSDPFKTRFAPAVTGLRNAIYGTTPTASNSQVFLGWSDVKHPFSPA